MVVDDQHNIIPQVNIQDHLIINRPAVVVAAEVVVRPDLDDQDIIPTVDQLLFTDNTFDCIMMMNFLSSVRVSSIRFSSSILYSGWVILCVINWLLIELIGHLDLIF